MPRRRKEDDDTSISLFSLLPDRIKALVVAVCGVLAVAILIGFLSMLRSADSALTDIVTKPQEKADFISKALMACDAEAHQQGLKNADAMAYTNECTKQKTAEFDAKH